jgi:hypothetical protein
MQFSEWLKRTWSELGLGYQILIVLWLLSGILSAIRLGFKGR